MGVESGCFPASVIKTCTGLRPPVGFKKTGVRKAEEESRGGVSCEKEQNSHNKTVLPVASVGESWQIFDELHPKDSSFFLRSKQTSRRC